LISAFIGVAITKLFMLNSNFDNIIWLAAALSCGLSSVAMGITKTVHPPAGATALLAASESAIRGLGWWYIPVVLLSSMIMLCVALLFNNLQRRYPKYWWTPLSLDKAPVETDASVIEKQLSRTSTIAPQSEPELVITAKHICIPPWLEGALGREQILVLEELRELLMEESSRLKREETAEKPHHHSLAGTQNGSNNTLINSGPGA
jgi:hypothetical protein